MKTASLNISERVNALGILNAFKGNLDKLAVILEDIKQFTIDPEEWEKAGMEKTTDAEGNVTHMTWDNEKGGDKEITMQDTTVEYLRAEIKRKDEAGEFGLSDKSFITLKEKLA